MKRFGVWLLGVCILALNMSAVEGGAAAMKKAGYTLLDMYVKSFQEMAPEPKQTLDALRAKKS
jgi:hypothetical protein